LRAFASVVFLVIFCIFTLFSLIVRWIDDEIQNTDSYVRTVAPLASNKAIQSAVTDAIMRQLSTVDLEASVKRLVPSADVELGPSLVEALNDFARSTVEQVVASNQYATLWAEANRAVHQVVIAVLTGEESAYGSSVDGAVRINLQPILTEVVRQLDANGIPYFDQALIGAANTQIELFSSSDLEDAQWATNLLHEAAGVLPFLAIVALALTILLANDRRKSLIRVGFALVGTMTLVLVLLAVIRSWQTDQLEPSSRAAAQAFYDTILAGLRDGARLTIGVGLVVAVIAMLSRESARARLLARLRAFFPWVVRQSPLLLQITAIAALFLLCLRDQRDARTIIWLGILAIAAGLVSVLLSKRRTSKPR
jgi:hypothetical protein